MKEIIKDKEEVKVAKVDDGLAAKVRRLEDKVERISANWKKFCAVHIGNDEDGKIGSVANRLVGILALVSIAGFAIAGVVDDKSVGGGTYTLSESGGTMTLTVDAISVSTTATLPAGGVASAALTDKDELATLVTPVVVKNANGGTNVVTFTITDIAGTAITYPCAIRFWISDDGLGTPSAVADDVAISGGIELQQIVDKADYWILTTNGTTSTVIATITDTPGGTNYIHAMAPGGRVTRVVSAFDTP